MIKYATAIRNRVSWLSKLSVSDKAISQVLEVYDTLNPKSEDDIREAFLAGRKAGKSGDYWSYQEWKRYQKIQEKPNSLTNQHS